MHYHVPVLARKAGHGHGARHSPSRTLNSPAHAVQLAPRDTCSNSSKGACQKPVTTPTIAIVLAAV